MRGLGRIFLIFLFQWQVGLAAESPVLFYDFVERDLLTLSEFSGTNEILAEIKSKNPELRIVVLDQEFPYFAKDKPISYRDPDITIEAHKFYSDYSSTMIQNVGFYMSPGAEMTNNPDRPLKDFPLMVVKKNIPLHALYHEMGHFFLDRAKRNGEFSIPNDEDLNSLVEKTAEESFVDHTLLQYTDVLSFQKEDICPRQKYLAQNNQVFQYFLGELSQKVDSFSDEDRAIFQELSRLRSEAHGTQHQWHSQCFFWKNKSY